MNIVFRVDASLKMGTGHLMRCLTLADALKAKGANCHFISREHPGNLNTAILQRGHLLSVLPFVSTELQLDSTCAPHADWLGTTWQNDAIQTLERIAGVWVDWLIVDHYALDHRWERQVAKHCGRLFVIDDLADRNHDCSILLDQNLGRQAKDYSQRVPSSCQLLLGPQFSLLRPEFVQLREQSLAHREGRRLGNLLISMGGVDAQNVTGKILVSLQPVVDQQWNIQIVMGSSAPWITEIEALAKRMPCSTKVLINTNKMAELMSEADLAIGAAGSTSWERCCLGLPSIILILADNQRGIGEQLETAGVAVLIKSLSSINMELPKQLEYFSNPTHLHKMAKAAEKITDGNGTLRVLSYFY